MNSNTKENSKWKEIVLKINNLLDNSDEDYDDEFSAPS